MTTTTRSVAVVATRLPNIDRRVLSQAWYSALHVAEPAARGATSHPANPAVSPGGHVRRDAPADAARVSAAGVPARTGVPAREIAVRQAPSGLPGVDRRAAASELARRIERAVARQVARGPVSGAAVALEAGGGRVHVLIQTDGTTTRIVALCVPHLREPVDRALAHARFALAASGARIAVAE